MKRNRLLRLSGGEMTPNRDLETKARNLAGIKGYVTYLDASAEFVIGTYHRLFQIEISFRMSESGPQARTIYYHTKDSINAYLTIVFAALAIIRWIEHITGWSIRRFVRTARRYRSVDIQAGGRTITAADPLPDGLQHILDAIHSQRGGAH